MRAAAALAGAGTLAGVTTALLANRELHHFELHEYTLPLLKPGTLGTNTLGKPEEFRILHLSDLHMIPGQEDKEEWVSGLVDLRPDLVINTGDNLSHEKGVPHVLRALGGLLDVPGLFVFGSNDYYGPRPVNPFLYLLGKKRPVGDNLLPWEGMKAAFQEHGWLDATHARRDIRVGRVKIAAAGVDDPHHDLDDYSTIAGPPNERADLAIALVHAPEPRVLDRFEADGYQLCFCGHTHGGQLCLPGGRAIVTNCGIDRERARGLHRWKSMLLHVTNGLGTSRYVPFRVFCRPSATLLRITDDPAYEEKHPNRH
ncbi:metallophosphoesterase [Corynebacterium uropygiale]|uniref:metallophosphoesterase n=1 Tax=Corynebacterium uropygiale TaxID=1775911 RepID=UPI003B83883D